MRHASTFRSHQASDPQKISLYLSSHGWQAFSEPGGTLWLSDDEEFEVFVPRSRLMRGYATYVDEMLRTLATVEERPEERISLEISASDADVQYVHTDPDADPGTTPIEEGVKAFESLRQWVLSGAVSASSEHPRVVQPRRKPARALDFMRSVRLGPTFEGSYILSVYIPIPPNLGQMQFEGDDWGLANQPFQRQVSITLRDATSEALSAADDVIQRREGIEAFTRRAGRGVTANLCEAVTGFSSGEGGDASIAFSWALSRPVPSSPPINVSRDQIAVLGEAARELKADEPEEDVTVVGAVVRLHRDGAYGPGEVSIAGIVEGGMNDRLRRIWFELPEDDYSVATRAHDNGSSVSVLGTLVRRGNRFVMQNPRDFTVKPDPSGAL
jgi:hypothetical protein